MDTALPDDILQPHPDYVQGFNEGYKLAAYAPEVAGRLSDLEIRSERAKGWKDGQAEYTREKEQTPRRDWLKSGAGYTEPGNTPEKNPEHDAPERD